MCLLALALLHAPIALAAWSIQTGMCCTGDYCPIAAHHHHKTQEAPAHDMNCGHDMGGHEMSGHELGGHERGAMNGCTMSCCHDSIAPAIATVAFVLPLVISLDGLVSANSGVVLTKQTNFLRSVEPLSPPPRFSSSLS